MAGMECSWMVEVDKFGSQILKHHWPNAEIYGDIYTIDGKELEPVDLICGGFPCQPVSQAGKRAGTADERWLWGEFARIIRQVKPRWVVAENVTGLLSANSGRAFAEVLRDLAQIGYDAVWNVFPAGGQGGVGAPHRRERIFIIAKKITDTNDKRVKRRKRLALVQDGRDSDRIRSTLADTDREGSSAPLQRSSRSSGQQESTSKVSRESNAMADTDSTQRKRNSSTVRISEKHTDISSSSWWKSEPVVGRVAHGVPNRVDRLKALGNAVVPQVAKQIGEMIMEIESV
jgi:DNA (cytosine-5)-methyltransferase 1